MQNKDPDPQFQMISQEFPLHLQAVHCWHTEHRELPKGLHRKTCHLEERWAGTTLGLDWNIPLGLFTGYKPVSRGHN